MFQKQEIQADIMEILIAGHLAPSADNSQPWLFNIEGNSIIISHDLENTHANHLYNIDYFADYVSLGAVLENILIGSKRHGYTSEIISVGQVNGAFSARVELRKTHEPKSFSLFNAISKRKTNRKNYFQQKIPSSIKNQVFSIAEQRGARLHWIEDDKLISDFADIMALHDTILWEDESLRKNLLRMLRPGNKKHQDGLSIKSLELGIKRYFFYPSIKLARYFTPLWKILAFNSVIHTRNNIKKSGALVIITLPKNQEPDTYFEGGRIMQSIWLNLEMNNVSVQPMFGSLALMLNKKLGLGGLSKKHKKIRDKISDFFHNQIPELEKTTPVALFRVGYADEPKAKSGRKNIDLVIKKVSL